MGVNRSIVTMKAGRFGNNEGRMATRKTKSAWDALMQCLGLMIFALMSLTCLSVGASADGDIDNIADDSTFISRNDEYNPLENRDEDFVKPTKFSTCDPDEPVLTSTCKDLSYCCSKLSF
ncbi:uncharacterized protein LOC142352867 [Convolutriloba macropyga]|uniref:uncharacterized protein LOC142352867 n=1 Tax=Convolutriloba macropyga TaxID=536237 RepID=UPI003F524C96